MLITFFNRYCLQLYAKSPAAYHMMQSVLVLLFPATLRLERNKCGAINPGIQSNLLKRLACAISHAQENHEKMAVVIVDEMTVKG